MADYEAQAQNLHLLNGEIPRPANVRAKRSVRAGIRFRRKVVEEKLSQYLLRKEVRLFKGPHVVPEAAYERRTYQSEFDSFDLSKLRIEKSQVGLRIWTKRQCEIDTEQLVTLIMESKSAPGPKARFDWAEIERWMRGYIATRGLPANPNRLVEKFLDSDNESAPDSKQLHVLAARLHEEFFVR